MRILYTIIISIFCLCHVFGQDMETDSLSPKQATEYSGYRIYISNPKLIKEKKSKFKMSINITNTGSLALESSKRNEFKNRLIIKEDKALGQIGKGSFEDLIYEKIRNSKIDLRSGQSQTLELKVKIPKDRRMDDDGFLVDLGNGGRKDYSRDLCPDLVVDSLVLTKKDHKNAIVEFQVRNDGKGAINIIGDPKNKNDNIAVGAFFSGTKKYSSGDLLAGQIFLTGLKETKGILFPGQTMNVRMKVSRKKQSKYTRVLLILVDSSGVVIECNEGNNYQNVLLR